MLDHVVGLTKTAQRDRITVNSIVNETSNILYIDEVSLLGVLTPNTTMMARMKIKSLKHWVERQEGLGVIVDIQDFTTEVCRNVQR